MPLLHLPYLRVQPNFLGFCANNGRELIGKVSMGWQNAQGFLALGEKPFGITIQIGD